MVVAEVVVVEVVVVVARLASYDTLALLNCVVSMSVNAFHFSTAGLKTLST